MNILITGGKGYIGNGLYKGLSLLGYNITSISRDDFDLTNFDKTNDFFKDKYFDYVIHTAVNGGSRLQPDLPEHFKNNVSMFTNLYYNKNKYNKFINLTSGAEDIYPDTNYGSSKKYISNLIHWEYKFFNIKIYNVFDKDELETRFIKSNIKRYIKREDMIIHQNRYMDFFYMEDLVTLINFHILQRNFYKEIKCVYKDSPTLLDIANIINKLDNYKVNINVEKENFNIKYTGKYTPLLCEFKGLQKGIEQTYTELIYEY